MHICINTYNAYLHTYIHTHTHALQAQLEGDPFTRVAVQLQRGGVTFTVELVRTPILEDEVIKAFDTGVYKHTYTYFARFV